MKKVLLFMGCVSLMLSGAPVFAQDLTEGRAPTFSPGLLSSPVNTKTQKNVRGKRVVKKSRTTILRFESDETNLTDAQKEILYKIAGRLTDGKTKAISVTAASTTQGISAKRAITIETFLKGYGKDFQYYVRFIQPEHVVPSVNNTVKIIERN